MSTTQPQPAKISEKCLESVMGFLQHLGVNEALPNSEATAKNDFYSDLLRSLIKLRHVGRGHISWLLSVKPAVANPYGSLQGGMVAAVAEAISFACAATVVAQNKHLFLGDLSIYYLSAAPQHAELIVDGCVERSGRNLTVIAVEFKLKETEKLVYTSRAIFFNMPISKL